MFAQVIPGRTSGPAGLRAALDRWLMEVRPGSQVLQGRLTDADRARQVRAHIPGDAMAAYRRTCWAAS